MGDVLRVEDLSVEFRLPSGPVSAVDRVSFRVPRGGTVALVGESGSGKSVISQAVLGILPMPGVVTGGRIWFDDPAASGAPVDLLAEPARLKSVRGARISLIFQEPMSALSPLHTIGDQVSEALFLHRRLPRSAGIKLVKDMLRLVGFPDVDRAFDAYTFQLSGGLRQRAVIAMALVCQPALLIADEPTTALDVTVQAQVLQLLRSLQAELGMAVLFITHDMGVVANMAESVVVMYRGRVMESGPLRPLFERPQHPYLVHLLDCVPNIGATPPRPEPPPDTLLELAGVSKTYPARRGVFGRGTAMHRAVAEVDLAVRQGECLGLVGESGCGKTTLSKLILRALDADGGTIRFRGADGHMQDVRALAGPDLKAYHRAVQFIFQDPFGSLNPRMTVQELIAEPLVIHGVGDAAQRTARVVELLKLVGLDPRYKQRYPHSFSGGQRQRIGIARALALEPRLLICDEPVSALDVSIQAQILKLIEDLRERLGLTLIFVSHNLAVVDYVADRIAVMCAGRIVEIAGRDQLFSRPQHPYTQALLAAVPLPDPDRRLDFRKLLDGRASDPAAWPMPFRIAGAAPPLVEVGPGHHVRRAA